MHQAFDAVLQFDEGAVVRQAHHLAAHPAADGILFCEPQARGPAVFCLMPSETFCFSRSYLRMTTSILSPTFKISEGWLILPQDMSVIWSRPSMPPRSTKAPYSVTFLTVPAHDLAFGEGGERFFLFGILLLLEDGPAGKHDIAAAGVHLDDLHLQHLPDHLLSWCTGLVSIWEPGRKAATPPMSTVKPPLIAEITVPFTGVPV